MLEVWIRDETGLRVQCRPFVLGLIAALPLGALFQFWLRRCQIGDSLRNELRQVSVSIGLWLAIAVVPVGFGLIVAGDNPIGVVLCWTAVLVMIPVTALRAGFGLPRA
jgi:hypothetical protein